MMINPWIIDKIKEKEREEEEDRPFLEIPLEEPIAPKKNVVKSSNRGVVVIDMNSDEGEVDE